MDLQRSVLFQIRQQNADMRNLLLITLGFRTHWLLWLEPARVHSIARELPSCAFSRTRTKGPQKPAYGQKKTTRSSEGRGNFNESASRPAIAKCIARRQSAELIHRSERNWYLARWFSDPKWYSIGKYMKVSCLMHFDAGAPQPWTPEGSLKCRADTFLCFASLFSM